MRLKLDENLGRSIAELFREPGHDVVTVWEQDLMSATDAALYEVCVREKRTLVSLDLDFSNPFRFDPAVGAGIAVLRLPSQSNREDLEEVAHTLLEALGRASIAGRLWVVRASNVREYEPGAEDQ